MKPSDLKAAGDKDLREERKGTQATAFDIYWPLALLLETLQERPIKTDILFFIFFF